MKTNIFVLYSRIDEEVFIVNFQSTDPTTLPREEELGIIEKVR